VAILAEHRRGEHVTFVADDHLGVPAFLHIDQLAGRRAGRGCVLHDVERAPIVNRQIACELALLLPSENFIEIVLAAQWSVSIVRARRQAREASIELRRKRRQKRVAGFDRVNAAQTQLLHQPVLKRLVGALYATFRLRRIGAENVDVELRHRAPELRYAVAAAWFFGADAEDGMFV
jgi:hypothetical protein